MGNWLGGRTDGLCSQLTGIASIFDTIKKDFTASNDTYYLTAQNVALKTGSTTGLAQYQGQGAQAFLTAVDSDVNKVRPLADSFGHVSSASDTFSGSIKSSSTTYDGKLAAVPGDPNVPFSDIEKWRDALVDNLFSNTGTAATPYGAGGDQLSPVLQNGAGFMDGPWLTAFNAVETMAMNDAQQWINQHPVPVPVPGPTPSNGTPSSTPNPQDQYATKVRGDYLFAFCNLAADVNSYISSWANDLQSAYKTFQTSIQNPDGYLTARDLYDLIYYGSNGYTDGTQGTNSPITITPYTTKDGKKGLLITLGGTDMGHLTNDDSILTALETGEGLPQSYLVEIHNALETYMSEHPDMKGAELTFAGYSLGGMQAQLFTDAMAGGEFTDLTQTDGLHVANVITYGAPIMGPPANGVNYTMYDATDDPIPLLSYYENPQLLKLKNILQEIDTNPQKAIQDLQKQGGQAYQVYLSLIRADQLPWQQKVNTYIDPKHQYHIIPITDVGTTSIGSGDPQIYNANPFAQVPIAGRPIAGLIPIPAINPGHQLNFNNHLQYFQSNQLNSPLTATNIDPNSLGPTEYFPLKQ